MSSTNEEILHYQRKILKYGSDAKVLLHCLNKLTKLPIGVEHLQATGIGRTINGMRKQEGAVGEEARALVNKWKEMVAAEDKSDSDAPEEPNNYHAETPSENNLNETSPSHSKKDRDSKKKDSPKEKSRDHTTSSSSSKSGSSREKSPDKHNSKSSKGSEKRKSSKDGESSRSNSKQSRKRHHSQEDINSPADEENDEDAPTQSFADVLGSIETVSKKKKSKDKDKEKSREKKKVSVPPPVAEIPSVLPSKAPLLLPKSLDIRLSDFEISPHYKPLPLKFVTDSPPLSRDKTRTAEEALSVAMAQKGSRTKVFSGNRSSGLAYVPTLFDFCIRILQQNIDALEYTGGVPFDLLRPVLERASAQQLYNLENHNPYLLDDTDELWKQLCQKEYRKAVREEMETWRDLYLRCHEEREARLKSLAINHKQSMAKATPVRTTKLAFAEEVVKIHRGAGKGGPKQSSSAVLASMTNAKAGARPFEASSKGANGSNAIAEVVKMAPPSASRSSSSSSASAPAAKKPKVAPLMQKTLKLMKNRFRR